VNLVFADDAWEDYLHWQEKDPQTLKRIHQLLKDIMRNPYRGIGKPEPLKVALTGLLVSPDHRRTPDCLPRFRRRCADRTVAAPL
jgi:Txe/YoeB family toxin of toxin-antitoxin system